MFFHNFKYSLITLFRNKMLIFWTFAFPIILGTFFNMAFSDIEKNEKLDIINIAVVNNEAFSNNIVMKEVFKKLSDKNNSVQLFQTEYVSELEANSLLNDNKIDGYVIANDYTTKVVVKENGINATILKYVVDEISMADKIIKNFQASADGNSNTDIIDMTTIYNKVLKMQANDDDNIKDISSHNLSYTMIEFYTLIAMTCLYGGLLSMVAINNNLANISNHGKRISITPVSKGKMILSSVLASYVTQIIGISLLFLYLYFGLHINFGTNFLLVILLALIGSLAGISLGVFISCIVKANENTKTGIVISITMLGCFLSGMMGITMKYLIDKNVPIINKINPANMITDGFYSLYYYDTLNRYWFNVISLLVFSSILIFISYIVLRRQKYDHI